MKSVSTLPTHVASKIAPDAAGCWLWTGWIGSKGYAGSSINKRYVLVHRLVYSVLVGPIPETLQLDHLCRVRHCVNPDHLEPVTPRENLMRSPIAPAALNARKTHCVHGHPLSGDNLRIARYGPHRKPRRKCRQCARAQASAAYWRAREAEQA